MKQGNRVADMPPLIARLNAMRREAGRDHRPFEVVMVLRDPWDVDLFRRAEDIGVTAILLPPIYFTLGRRSTLEEKAAVWESFAEKVLRHFQPTAPDAETQAQACGNNVPRRVRYSVGVRPVALLNE